MRRFGKQLTSHPHDATILAVHAEGSEEKHPIIGFPASRPLRSRCLGIWTVVPLIVVDMILESSCVAKRLGGELMYVEQHLATNRETIQVGVVPANNIALCLYCIFIIMHPILISGLTQSHNGTNPQPRCMNGTGKTRNAIPVASQLTDPLLRGFWTNPASSFRPFNCNCGLVPLTYDSYFPAVGPTLRNSQCVTSLPPS